jgi:hypothetical protein
MGASPAPGQRSINLGTLLILGLFDWGDKLLEPKDVQHVAEDLLDSKKRPVSAQISGWYTQQRSVPWAGGALDVTLGVTHSRFVARVALKHENFPSGTEKIRNFRDYRKAIEDAVLKEIRTCVRECLLTPGSKGNERLQELKEKPFLYVYPIYNLSKIGDRLVRAPEHDWSTTTAIPHASKVQFPFVLEATSFSLKLHQRQRLWAPSVAPIRISGASITTSRADDQLVQRLIDIVYFAALYRMTQSKTAWSGYGFATSHQGVRPGIEATVVESQMQELTRQLEGEATQRQLNRLTVLLTTLSIVLVALTVVLATPVIRPYFP